MTAVPESVLVALQEGLPLCPRPFAALGDTLGLSEDALLAQTAQLLAAGTARRLGGIFDSRRMGFATALCAARIDFPSSGEALAEIIRDPHITHCYERGPRAAVADLQGEADWSSLPNLWFTYGALPTAFAAGLERVRRLLSPADVLVLPATRHFQTRVILGRKAGSAAMPAAAPNEELPPLTAAERQLVASLQGSVAPCADFFGAVAGKVGWSRRETLECLQNLHACGRLKRIALVLRHRSAGFAANAMCCWAVSSERIEQAGAALAAAPCVTHCYERRTGTGFPYNLFAMLHARTWRDFRRDYGTAVESLNLAGGILMCSLREFKKTSPVYV